MEGAKNDDLKGSTTGGKYGFGKTYLKKNEGKDGESSSNVDGKNDNQNNDDNDKPINNIKFKDRQVFLEI